MALTKLSITDEQQETVKELVSKGWTGAKIAKKLKLSQSTMWRNMEIMGLNCKQKKGKKKKKLQPKKFSWNNFKYSSLI